MFKKFVDEFKKFALRGNVMDLAVGVIIGGAFSKIVTSIVNDIIMPLIGVLLGGFDFKSLKWIISPAIIDGTVVIKPEAALLYGNFIQNVVDFLIVALSIFIMIKLINGISEKVKKQEEIVIASVPPKPTATEELLAEIRDLMKNSNV